MKRTLQLSALLILSSLMGCSSSPTAYSSKATLSPGKDAGQYGVAFEIQDITNPENPSMISSPRLIVLKGQQGTISIEDEKRVIVCTVLVADASGTPQALTTVNITQNGQTVWSAEQTVALAE